MANNPRDGEKPSYHEVPAKKYVFLFETAIHKRFFFYWTLVLWLSTWIATRFIGVDMLIAQWHMQNWWIAFPYAAIGIGAAYIWQREVTRTARMREKEAAKRLAWANTYIDKNLPPHNDRGEVNFKDE